MPWPIYILCDESASMDANGGIDAVNRGLTELHAFIAGDPLVSDKCRIGLITFSDTAEELLPLSNLSDVQAMPGCTAKGMTNYGEAFNLLRVVISRDIANMKSQGIQVYRPLVFFITDGEPTDDWEASYRALSDKIVNPQAPHIIAFGVDGANPAVIGKIGTKGAFIANQWVDSGTALTEILKSIKNTIREPNNALNAPPGTTAVHLTRSNAVNLFYFLCDESTSMDAKGGIDAVNRWLPELHVTMEWDPFVSDICRIGLITFSDTAEELLPLSNLSDVQAMPRCAAKGMMSNYGEAFNLLRVVISRDIANMKSQGIRVGRPAVLFITDGEPTDDWEASHRALTDKSGNPQAPHIIAFGVAGANPAVIGKIGTKAAFIAKPGVTPRTVLKEVFQSFISDKADDEGYLWS